MTRAQLLALGHSPDAIRHRLAEGRLHPTWRGVYAVGRPDLTREGIWMAAALTCNGPLSDSAAAAHWAVRPDAGRIEVTVPPGRRSERPGIVVHRRQAETTTLRGIPVTSLVQTFVDISKTLTDDQLEQAINQANNRGLTSPEALRKALDGRRAAERLRRLLDRRAFVLTDSALERLFRPLARKAGLPRPLSRARVNGFQATDRRRDQVHTIAGLTPLRFTHAQVAYEPDHVRKTLAAVAARLG